VTSDLLDKSTERKVLLGIRPCDLIFDANAKPEKAIDIDVVVSEYIGAQSVLIGDCSGQKVMVEVKSDTPIALGERLRFAVNLNDIHFFNTNNDQVIA